MAWSPLKKRVCYFLSLGVLVGINTLIRGYIPLNWQAIINHLLLLTVSFSMLYIFIKDFMTGRKREESEAKKQQIYKEIAERILKGKRRERK